MVGFAEDISGTQTGPRRAFIYAGGGMTFLPTLGGTYADGTAIADDGAVTGNAAIAGDLASHAFLYADATIVDLGTLGGRDSKGFAINAARDVTGWSATPMVSQRAFLYSQGTMTDIGNRSVGGSIGFGINSSGIVVGEADTNGRYRYSSIRHAFAYIDGQMHDLNSLVVTGGNGLVFASAEAINEAGQIVVSGYNAISGGTTRGYRLDPVGTAVYPPPVGAIEFYNATLDHYFLTIDGREISDLDTGVHKGWARTGRSFDAYPSVATGMRPVCRFYIPPAKGDSHFFSASADECAQVLVKIQSDPNYSGYVLESAAAFHAALPDVSTSACPIGTIPVYRLWNNRVDSNHRYTTDVTVRDAMIARGYVAEGYGTQNVAMCAPTFQTY